MINVEDHAAHCRMAIAIINPCIYDDEWGVVWAIDKAFIRQVLSRKRASSRWGLPFGVLFARRASPCLPLPIPPGTASAVLASSPGEAWCFQNNCSHLKCLFERIDTYQSECKCA